MIVDFIASLSTIKVFKSFAASEAKLWIQDFAILQPEFLHTIYIWPELFPWTPIYGQTGGPGCPPERAGLYYVANRNIAPVLELSGSHLEKKQFGRIYWGRDFSAPDGLTYDEVAFAKLVDKVWRYIRKVGTRDSSDRYSPYYLPEAAKLSL